MITQNSDIQDELKKWGWEKVKIKMDQNIIKEGYQGKFRGIYGGYKGFVWEDENSVLIKNPPSSALNGRAGLCISETSRGWYIIHFKRGNNVLGRIAEVEKYLREVGA